MTDQQREQSRIAGELQLRAMLGETLEIDERHIYISEIAGEPIAHIEYQGVRELARRCRAEVQ
jgi:hypothetical protein